MTYGITPHDVNGSLVQTCSNEARLITCNDKVRDLFPATSPILKPGVSFAALLRASVEAGEVKAAIGRTEEWLARRLARYDFQTSY